MIFDNKLITDLYKDYITTGDCAILEVLHKEVMPLIEVIALSVSKEEFDDLVQEAHIKLRHIVQSCQFNLEAESSMYSYLSIVLRNHMVDYLRRNVHHISIEDIVIPVDYNYHELEMLISEYIPNRFPSLHGTVVQDATNYVISGMLEKSNEKSRGISRTLEVVYPQLNRSQAYVFYNSILVYMRLSHLNEITKEHEKLALSVLPDKEYSLVPEVLLASSCDCLLKAMEGVYVKF